MNSGLSGFRVSTPQRAFRHRRDSMCEVASCLIIISSQGSGIQYRRLEPDSRSSEFHECLVPDHAYEADPRICMSIPQDSTSEKELNRLKSLSVRYVPDNFRRSWIDCTAIRPRSSQSRSFLSETHHSKSFESDLAHESIEGIHA